jgi:7,8-dihydro-6-hydroxymethylpterin dimethyltransferase
MKVVENIFSICPACFKEGKIQKITARIIEEDEKIWITKNCQDHGSFKEIYFDDVNLYKKWMKYKVTGNSISEVKTRLFDDPELYEKHTSQTMLTNLVVTNRCNQMCTYCFTNARATEYVYEPTLEQLKDLMQQTRDEKPIGSHALQITGGEPTLRDDLFDIIRMAKEVGFTHVQLQTNGMKLAESADYCQRLKTEKVNSVYLSFSGLTETTNPQLQQNKKAIENLRKASLNTVLVPVLIGDKNSHEAGKIIRFAIDNIDVVRGLHFQPISFCSITAKVNDDERKLQRVGYFRILESIEEEFQGMISRDDFYPVSFVFPIFNLIEKMTYEPQIKYTVHPGCGGSTFIFMDGEKPVPITRFVDVEADMKFLTKQSKKKGPLRKLRIASAFIRNINTFIDYKKAPQGFDSKKIFKDATIHGSKYALRDFYYKGLFIGFMGYMDPWNMNLDRLQRCVVHCPTFEGIIPFCTYSGLGYGKKIEKKYSIPAKDWEKKTGRLLKDDLVF